jgi:hypothetical protein
VAATAWDLVIGCDLIYSEDRISPFLIAATALLQGGARRVLYCHRYGRSELVDAALDREVKAAGLNWQLLEHDHVLKNGGLGDARVCELSLISGAK